MFLIDTEQDFEAGDILLLLGDCACGQSMDFQTNELAVVLLSVRHFGKVAFIQSLVHHVNGELTQIKTLALRGSDF